MPPKNTSRRDAGEIRRDEETHIYQVGQAVRLRSGFGRPAAASNMFHITATLPPRDGALQYRIRSDEERHERVTTQDNLDPVDTPPEGSESTLAERTFGHGQGTKTQQPRSQETEAE